MKNDVRKGYETMADNFEKWYGVEQEKVLEMFKLQGADYVFNNAQELGLAASQAEELKKMYEIMVFYNENKKVLENV